jgi:hypothetical protein
MSNMVGFIQLNLFVKIDLFEWGNHPFYRIRHHWDRYS